MTPPPPFHLDPGLLVSLRVPKPCHVNSCLCCCIFMSREMVIERQMETWLAKNGWPFCTERNPGSCMPSAGHSWDLNKKIKKTSPQMICKLTPLLHSKKTKAFCGSWKYIQNRKRLYLVHVFHISRGRECSNCRRSGLKKSLLHDQI